MTQTPFCVVANLSLDRVTWAGSFVRAARSCGIEVFSEAQTEDQSCLYLGDCLPIQTPRRRGWCGYFLAASSLPPSDDASDASILHELTNAHWADAIVVPSQAEKTKLLSLDATLLLKITVAGFPVDLQMIRRLRGPYRDPRAICFIGETRPIKNPALEVQVCRTLIRLGYSCKHYSPGPATWRQQLQEAGAAVIEGMRDEEYLRSVRQSSIVVSTSHYEALSVSSIEACALGCIPVVPDVGGFQDWCPARLRYVPGNHDDLVAHVLQATRATDVDIARYDALEFFAMITQIQSRT